MINDRQAYDDIIKFEVDKAKEATKRRIGKAFWRWFNSEYAEDIEDAILRITGVSEPKIK